MALNPKVKNEITLRRVLESLEIISERLKLSTNKTNSLKMKSLDRQVIRILLYETKKQHIKTISLIRFLKECLHLWKWRNSNQESTHRSTLQISFRPKILISALDQQRQITEIERIKINEILEDLIIQDFQLIHHSFQKHWRECLEGQQLLRMLNNLRKRHQFKVDNEEIQLKENEQAQRKETQFQLLKNQSFHQRTNFFNQRNYHMVVQMLNKSQIFSQEKQLKQKFTLEMLITVSQEDSQDQMESVTY